MDNTAPEPNNFLNWVDIKNFKSIKDLHLDCKRVNVFIGKPNVGKSNILEGLGLLGGRYSNKSFLSDFLRYKEIRHLFHENDDSLDIEIATNKGQASVRRLNGSLTTYEYREKTPMKVDISDDVPQGYMNLQGADTISYFTFQKDGELDHIPIESNELDLPSIRKYDFANLNQFKGGYSHYLMPPHGINLFSIVDRSDELKNDFGKLFKEQGLDFVLDRDEQQFELQRKAGYYVHKFPFFSIADTFRRYMFYITAIESNKNSVIVFEEPEVHSFPPYVKAMAHRMVSSDTNQFFVSTHSPYLLQTLISELDESELAVYITYYQDYQTHVRQLTADELQEAQDLGIDLFYNLSRYEPNA